MKDLPITQIMQREHKNLFLNIVLPYAVVAGSSQNLISRGMGSAGEEDSRGLQTQDKDERLQLALMQSVLFLSLSNRFLYHGNEMRGGL
jgi:hypothetical protein